MKKYTIRLIALVVFASVTISSCSVEYREHRDHGYDHHDDHHDDHRYDRY